MYTNYSENLDRYYIGSTSDLRDRIKKNTNHKGFTGKSNDWRFVYSESFLLKKEASDHEKEIKNWRSRKMIEKLIRNSCYYC